MLRQLTISLVFGLFFVSPSHGEQPVAIKTGNDLLALCEVDGLSCSYFIQGALDTYRLTIALFDDTDNIAICPPDGNTLLQANDMVVKYLKNNPGSRHNRAADLVLAVFIEHWRCEK